MPRTDPVAATVGSSTTRASRVYVPRVVAVEHIEGDGRVVDRVWQTYHWLGCLPGQLPPDQIDPAAELVALVPDCIYSESGKALR